jgi:hypothetical protein
MEGIWDLMSQDSYQLDIARHGGAHVDRYTRQGNLVGPYQLDKTPIKHKGVLPPTVPISDYPKFEQAIEARRRR